MAGSVWVLKGAASLITAKAHVTIPPGITNVPKQLGRILYTDYVYYFQIGWAWCFWWR